MPGRYLVSVAVTVCCVTTAADQGVPREPVILSAATTAVVTLNQESTDVVYMCPMDPDVRSHAAGTCRRCGMTLVAGIPEPVEFHTDLMAFPEATTPGEQSMLQFSIHDPWKDRRVVGFNPVHEKLFHAFVVSQDLEFFEHGHPRLVANGLFQHPIVFPKPGMYRVLGDFYPEGGLPQLVSNTVVVAGDPPPEPKLGRDYSEKATENLRVSFETLPEHPTATTRTQLRLRVNGPHALEKYLGVWGHMLVASSDLIDLMHEHPFLADGGERVEFEVVFPRPGAYRIWVQFQSAGVINTAHFDVPVGALE